MSIKIGSEVRFLNEVGGGIVTRIKDNLIWIKTEDGFEIPANKEEVVVIESDFQSNNSKKVEKIEVEKPYVQSNSYNFTKSDDETIFKEMEQEFKSNSLDLYLAFVPENEGNYTDSDLQLYIINDCEYEVFFNLISKYNNSYACIDSNIIEANVKYHVVNISRTQLNELSEIAVQVIAYKKKIYKPIRPFENSIKIKSSKFYKLNSYKENDFFDTKAIIYKFDIYNSEIENEKEEVDIEELKSKLTNDIFHKQTKVEQKIEKLPVDELEEVDLHIEKLVSNYNNMSNAEMLLTQISHFRTKLDSAIYRNVKKIVFIHGIGNGTLKHELRKNLEENYNDIKYQDASFKEYGYGATMVFLK